MKKQTRTWKAIYNFNNPSKSLHPIEFGHAVHPNGLNSGVRAHDAFCLHFVFSGVGTYNNHEVRAGNAFFSLPGQKFIYVSSNLCKWEHFYILFKESEAGNLLKPFQTRYKNQIFEFDNSKEMYENLHSFLYTEKKHSQYDFLALLFYLLSSEKYEYKRSKEDYVEETINIIQQSYYRNITVMDIAKYINISPRYLARIFKECTGKTVQEQILYKKIQHAKVYLKNSNMKIRDIAYSLGYENEFAFSAAFKKHTGISPRQFKKTELL